jgi:carbamoyltransferase
VNTSFNVRGEPIVCTTEDAYRCFLRTEIDVLVLGDYALHRAEQTVIETDDSWKLEYELD